MVFPVIGGDGKPTGYEIDNSLRFNESGSPTLNITFGSEGSKRTMTFSFWLKRSNFGDEVYSLYSAGADASNRDQIRFLNESLDIIFQRNDTTYYRLRTNRLFRDPSAWYHIVIGIDTTDGTSSNRIKLYVNGVQESSFATSDYPTQNLDLYFNDDIVQYIGRQYSSDANHYSGYIADWHFIDGTQYASSNFGETNDNGVWIPKKFADSFGSNGFKLEFKQTGTSANSSGMGADTSGNDHHWTPANLAATDVTTDTPTNNFATMNPLDNYFSAHTMSKGNVKFVTNASGDGPFQTATIGDLKRGKWYFEFKYTDPAHLSGGDAAGEFYGQIGICGSGLSDATDAAFSSFEHNFAYDSSNGRIKFNNTAGTVHGASISADGQIIGFLIDLDNNRVTTHLNGQYADGSGNHDESSPTAYVSVTAPASTPLGGYMIAFGENVAGTSSGTQNTGTYEINFGNPSFAISSSNTDANGYGNFEYAVPSGYYSLCTKNLAEFG